MRRPSPVRIVFISALFSLCLQTSDMLAQSPVPALAQPAANGAAGSPFSAAQPADPSSAEKSTVVNTSTPPAKAKFVEDWSSLPINDVPPELLPGDNLLVDTTDFPNFTRQLVEGLWRPGDPIDLYIVKPRGIKNPPVILYLYSYASSGEHRFQDLDFCNFLTKNGFAAVGFVSDLTGQRYHDVPQKQWFVSELPRTLVSTTHDVQFILDYLAKRGDMDMTRVGMFGDGSGAAIAILAAATDSRIKALDLLNPWGDWPDWFAHSTLVPETERADYLKPEFLSGLQNFDPVKWLPELKTPQVRLQYVMKGVTVTPDIAKQHVEAAAPPNVKIVNYENAHEYLQNVALKGTGFDWIKEQLGTPISQPGASVAASASSASAK